MLAYKVYADRYLLLDTYNDVNDGMVSAQMNLEINQPGSFEFSLVRGHPHIDDIRLMKTRIAVKMMYIENDEVLDLYWAFLGRVNSIDEDMYGNKSFTCEGAMAYLNDTYSEYSDYTFTEIPHIGEWLDRLINGYNAMIVDSQGYIYDENKLITTSPSGTDYGYSDPFYITGDADLNNKWDWHKTLDSIYDTIINAYGGVVNFVYWPPLTDEHIESGDEFTIHCKYYNNHNDWFSYEACNTQQPEISYYTAESSIPEFSFNTNMTDIKATPIKTGLWTCLLPIGKDGINIKTDTATEGYSYPDIFVPIGYLIERYGVIIKRVDFPTIETSNELLHAARDYNNRFMYKDWYALNNYTVRGIEPCLTTENDFIIRLGYPAKVQINDTEETIASALSIKHNLFDIQASEYVLGPIVPKNIIDEDMSSFIK